MDNRLKNFKQDQMANKIQTCFRYLDYIEETLDCYNESEDDYNVLLTKLNDMLECVLKANKN